MAHASTRARARREEPEWFELARVFAWPVGGVILLSLLGWLQLRHAASVWQVTGPPCATATRGGMLMDSDLPWFTTRYDGVRILRRSGAVTCGEAPEGDVLFSRASLSCAFASPGMLVVEVGVRRYYFRPGIGNAAIIRMRGGTPVCEVGPRSRVLAPGSFGPR